MALVAPLLCKNWQSPESAIPDARPVIGVPDGPYLAQTSPEGLSAFERQLILLEKAGYTVQHVRAMEDIETINRRHTRLIFAEMAQVHATWFVEYESLYRPRTVAAIREGQEVSAEELVACRVGRAELRAKLGLLMTEAGIDLWISPAAPGPAPKGITTTGNPIMNLPWTYAGMPAISLPAGHAANGLPLGLQCIAAFMADERLVSWTRKLAESLVGV